VRYGRVIGNIVSTMKNEKLNGIKLAIVEPLDPEGNVIGNNEIVADYLGAAVGNLVLWIANGMAICDRMGRKNIPLRSSIVGIIDRIDMKKENKTIKG
jgi:ethanolamine utilization protein EutN